MEPFRRKTGKKRTKSYKDSIRDKDGLLPKERVFVEFMLQDFDINPGEAAVNAGYSANMGSALLNRPVIRDAIKKRQKKLTEEFIAPIKVDQQTVISLMAEIAAFNPIILFKENSDWELKDMKDIPPGAARNIKKLIFREDYNTGKRVLSSVELRDSQKAQNDLAKHLGLFEKDNIQRQPQFKLDDILNAVVPDEETREKVRQELLKNIEEEHSIH